MKSKLLWGLIGLNAVLVFMLGGNFRLATAQAQIKRPADYVMIPCQFQDGLNEGVCIVDASSGMLGTMTYDDSNRILSVQTPINLMDVFSAVAPQR
jgi:hypothetical protein